MSSYKLDKTDEARILLTEILPYEVPILFSNEGLYRYYHSKNKKKPPGLITKILETNDYRIPFQYEIKKDSDNTRTLSIIHPGTQLPFIDFYKSYDSLIIHLCGKSPMSLRYPSKVATHYYYKHNEDKELRETKVIETERSGFEKEFNFSSSYFAYKKHPFLFKFYDSYEFLRLEKKFSNLLQFDISKCFESIYTHSISWAVKDKSFAKAHIFDKKISFESRFDTLMQRANYNETNGILIGSEASRIFAEIILQRIDLNVIESLKKQGFNFSVNYAVRRYVDDYFIFTNDEKESRLILREFKSELAKFKLHINTSKTFFFKTPFISDITIGRTELQKLLDEKFDNFLSYETKKTLVDGKEVETSILQIKDIPNSTNLSNWIIRDIKSIIKVRNIQYHSITGLCFSKFKRYLNEIFREYKIENRGDGLANLLLIVFDVMFFLYSMDYRVRVTYTMTQLVISTNRFVAQRGDMIKDIVTKKLYDELIYLIKNIEQSNVNTIEFLNLLISLKDLGDDYLLSVDALDKLLDIKNKIDNFTYFNLVVILYYIQDYQQYSGIKKQIEDKIIDKIETDEKPFHKAELTCLLFDSVRCPYVSRSSKEALVELAFKKVTNRIPNDTDRNAVINYISAQDWFISWDKNIDLDSILLKKELRTPY